MDIEKFNKMMEDKNKLYSPNFEGNKIKFELEKSDVYHCDKVIVTIEDTSKSAFWSLNRLFETEIERQKTIEQAHPSIGSFIDLMTKLSKEIKDKFEL
jgi:hypothetical protein